MQLGGDGALFASGDDEQMIKLYRFPAVSEDQEYREYAGHSSHVSAVLFSPISNVAKNGQPAQPLLISIGGMDHALLQWDVVALHRTREPPAVKNQPWVDPTPWKVEVGDPDEPPERRTKLPPRPSAKARAAAAAPPASGEPIGTPWATWNNTQGVSFEPRTSGRGPGRLAQSLSISRERRASGSSGSARAPLSTPWAPHDDSAGTAARPASSGGIKPTASRHRPSSASPSTRPW